MRIVPLVAALVALSSGPALAQSAEHAYSPTASSASSSRFRVWR